MNFLRSSRGRWWLDHFPDVYTAVLVTVILMVVVFWCAGA